MKTLKPHISKLVMQHLRYKLKKKLFLSPWNYFSCFIGFNYLIFHLQKNYKKMSIFNFTAI